MTLSALQEEVMEVVVKSRTPLSVSEVAAATRKTKSPVNRVLLQLVRAGRLERVGRHPDVRYRPLPFFAVDWTAPAWSRPEEEPLWIRERWGAPTRVDWRFPLLTRIPDERGRDVVRSFLLHASQSGYFTPWLLDWLDLQANASNSRWARLDPAARAALMKDPANHGHVTIIVYGSCARGDARRDSDVDLLALTPADPGPGNLPQFPYDRNLQDLADAVNLGASRPLDLLVVTEDALYEESKGLPERLRESIANEGKTVFTTDPTGYQHVESWGKRALRWKKGEVSSAQA